MVEAINHNNGDDYLTRDEHARRKAGKGEKRQGDGCEKARPDDFAVIF